MAEPHPVQQQTMATAHVATFTTSPPLLSMIIPACMCARMTTDPYRKLLTMISNIDALFGIVLHQQLTCAVFTIGVHIFGR